MAVRRLIRDSEGTGKTSSSHNKNKKPTTKILLVVWPRAVALFQEAGVFALRTGKREAMVTMTGGRGDAATPAGDGQTDSDGASCKLISVASTKARGM